MASDKARFYLEQTVPELREWERKELFTKDEITAIARKRSDFEHILNARGSRPADYARYVEYEMNLDALRQRRAKRKAVKATTHAGSRRIFNILDRATKKFHGDIKLWVQYLEYARAQRANKRLQRVLTDALRMHPTSADLWIYAAQYALDTHADVAAARGYMQRGLRFCKRSKNMYLEYARLEMNYLSKIAARRRILGIDSTEAVEDVETPALDYEADTIALPKTTSADTGESEDDDDNAVPTDLINTPALSGAIPQAIFEAAMREFAGDATLCESFFDLFQGFENVPCSGRLLDLVNDQLSQDPNSPSAIVCSYRMQLLHIAVDVPEFPRTLGSVLRAARTAVKAASSSTRPGLCRKLVSWLSSLESSEALIPDIKTVLAVSRENFESEISAVEKG